MKERSACMSLQFKVARIVDCQYTEPVKYDAALNWLRLRGHSGLVFTLIGTASPRSRSEVLKWGCQDRIWHLLPAIALPLSCATHCKHCNRGMNVKGIESAWDEEVPLPLRTKNAAKVPQHKVSNPLKGFPKQPSIIYTHSCHFPPVTFCSCWPW